MICDIYVPKWNIGIAQSLLDAWLGDLISGHHFNFKIVLYISVFCIDIFNSIFTVNVNVRTVRVYECMNERYEATQIGGSNALSTL